MVDGVEQFTEEAANRGSRGIGGGIGLREIGGEEPSIQQGGEELGEMEITVGSVKRTKPDEEEKEGDDAPKKPKLDIASLPWIVQDNINPPNLSPELRKTQTTLENIA